MIVCCTIFDNLIYPNPCVISVQLLEMEYPIPCVILPLVAYHCAASSLLLNVQSCTGTKLQSSYIVDLAALSHKSGGEECQNLSGSLFFFGLVVPLAELELGNY